MSHCATNHGDLFNASTYLSVLLHTDELVQSTSWSSPGLQHLSLLHCTEVEWITLVVVQSRLLVPICLTTIPSSVLMRWWWQDLYASIVHECRNLYYNMCLYLVYWTVVTTSHAGQYHVLSLQTSACYMSVTQHSVTTRSIVLVRVFINRLTVGLICCR